LRRDQHHIVRLGEEVQPQGGVDSGAVDALRPGPVEVTHGGEAPNLGPGQATFQAAAGALLLFVLDEMFEQLRGAPAALGGEGHDIVQVGGGVAQAEGGELVSERGHRGSPRRVGTAA